MSDTFLPRGCVRVIKEYDEVKDQWLHSEEVKEIVVDQTVCSGLEKGG